MKVYEIVQRYQSVERYWTGEGYCLYEGASFQFKHINAANDVASRLLAISKIQDGDKCQLKYFVLTIVDGVVKACMEVTEDK